MKKFISIIILCLSLGFFGTSCVFPDDVAVTPSVDVVVGTTYPYRYYYYTPPVYRPHYYHYRPAPAPRRMPPAAPRYGHGGGRAPRR